MSVDKRFAVAAFTIARFSPIIAVAYQKFFTYDKMSCRVSQHI